MRWVEKQIWERVDSRSIDVFVLHKMRYNIPNLIFGVTRDLTTCAKHVSRNSGTVSKRRVNLRILDMTT